MEGPKPKGKKAARALWIFTGCFGGHKFYLDKILGGLIDLTLFVFGVLFIIIWAVALHARADWSVFLLVVGIILVLFWLALWIYQGCFLSYDVSEYNRRLGVGDGDDDAQSGEEPLMGTAGDGNGTTPAGSSAASSWRPGGVAPAGGRRWGSRFQVA
jgi:hypothetical protein